MRVGRLLRFLAILLGCLLYAVPRWLNDEFGRVSLDQVLYHLRFGSAGLFSSDPELATRFLWRAITLPALLAAVLWALDGRLRQWRAPSRLGASPGAAASGGGASMRRLAAHAVLPRIVPLVVLGAGAAYFVDGLSIARHVRGYFGEDYFSAAYVDPARVSLVRGAWPAKSLVLIYVESLENSYADPALFGRDLLHRLNALKARPGVIQFEDYRELMGAHFTIASLVATQCGLPLKSVAMYGGNVQGERLERYLPRARCLGDILAAEGYTNLFLNGASLEFAGVGKFFRDHRYHKVMGREEWIAAGEPEAGMNAWGLRDPDLFERARSELERLMAARRPFNLTLLTIDTHHPYGHLSPHCRRQGYQDFDGLVECTAGLVADFIEHIIARGWLDRVAIVVQGDHLAMGNTSWPRLVQNPERRIFNLFISDDRQLAPNTSVLTHFDMLPTLLDFVGLEVKGGRAGLGYSALGPLRTPRPADRIARMSEQLMNDSPAYRALWEPLPEAPGALVPAATTAPAPVQATRIGHAPGPGGPVRRELHFDP